MLWIVCALILTAGLRAAYHHAATCTTVAHQGIGTVHVHEWPPLLGRQPRQRVLFYPDGQEIPYAVDMITASLVLSSSSFLEAVRYARQGGPDGQPTP